ncbi:MAG: hypothetical protein HYU28_04285 [Actinobacteria bacterium]|nr:hypothetical protein [Actinomycetota bacterium]
MDDRRLYQILAAGAGVVILIALADVVLGGGGDGDGEERIASAETSTSTSTTTTTTASSAPPSTTSTTTTGTNREPEAARRTQTTLRNALTAAKVVYADQQRYTDDPVQLGQIEPSVQFARGIASTNSAPDVVFVANNGFAQVTCLSAVSETGELYMVRDIVGGPNEGTWYTRGGSLPTPCDDTPLQDSW